MQVQAEIYERTIRTIREPAEAVKAAAGVKPRAKKPRKSDGRGQAGGR